MTIEECECIYAWFHDHVASLTPDDDKLAYLIRLKKDHSMNVAEQCDSLAQAMNWPQSDVLTAKALGLLHDVGRFTQLIRFRTFYDPDSVNHGEYGAALLRDMNVLSFLPEHEHTVILTGIRFHNIRTIPGDISGDSLRFLKLVRDSDKLDIYHVINHALKSNRFEDFPEIFLNIDFNGPVNPSALEQFLSRQTVSYENLKSLADFCLTQLSWIYDINYPAALRGIVDKTVIETIIEAVPGNRTIAHASQTVSQYIEEFLVTPVTDRRVN